MLGSVADFILPVWKECVDYFVADRIPNAALWSIRIELDERTSRNKNRSSIADFGTRHNRNSCEPCYIDRVKWRAVSSLHETKNNIPRQLCHYLPRGSRSSEGQNLPHTPTRPKFRISLLSFTHPAAHA